MSAAPHPHESRLTAYLLGELPPAEAAALTRELAANPALRAQLAELQEALAQVRAAVQATPAPTGLRPEQVRALQDLARELEATPSAAARVPAAASAPAAVRLAPVPVYAGAWRARFRRVPRPVWHLAALLVAAAVVLWWNRASQRAPYQIAATPQAAPARAWSAPVMSPAPSSVAYHDLDDNAVAATPPATALDTAAPALRKQAASQERAMTDTALAAEKPAAPAAMPAPPAMPVAPQATSAFGQRDPSPTPRADKTEMKTNAPAPAHDAIAAAATGATLPAPAPTAPPPTAPRGAAPPPAMPAPVAAPVAARGVLAEKAADARSTPQRIILADGATWSFAESTLTAAADDAQQVVVAKAAPPMPLAQNSAAGGGGGMGSVPINRVAPGNLAGIQGLVPPPAPAAAQLAPSASAAQATQRTPAQNQMNTRNTFTDGSPPEEQVQNVAQADAAANTLGGGQGLAQTTNVNNQRAAYALQHGTPERLYSLLYEEQTYAWGYTPTALLVCPRAYLAPGPAATLPGVTPPAQWPAWMTADPGAWSSSGSAAQVRRELALRLRALAPAAPPERLVLPALDRAGTVHWVTLPPAALPALARQPGAALWDPAKPPQSAADIRQWPTRAGAAHAWLDGDTLYLTPTAPWASAP